MNKSYFTKEWFFSYDKYNTLLKNNVISKRDIKSAEIVATDDGYKMKVTFKNVPMNLFKEESA